MGNKKSGDFFVKKRADWILGKKDLPMASLWGSMGKAD